MSSDSAVSPPQSLETTLRLTLPTFISLASLALTVVAGYGNYRVMQSEVDRLRDDVRALQTLQAKATEAAQRAEVRIQRTEDAYARLTETLAEMKADLRDIKAGLVQARAAR
jgi:uncharacterized protein HemX